MLETTRESDTPVPFARLPPRYPSCVVFGTILSRLFDEGFSVGGKVIRICHFETERFCYRHERRAFPVVPTPPSVTDCVRYHHRARWRTGQTGPGELAKLHDTDLPRIDLISTESIFVRTHLGG